MNYQEMFNKVWDHFIVKKNPGSYCTKKGACMYKSPSRAKCAVGIFIPPKLYDPDQEGLSGNDLLFRNPKLAKLLDFTDSVEDRTFISALQDSHDSSFIVAENNHVEYRINVFTDKLHKAAIRFSLTIPE